MARRVSNREEIGDLPNIFASLALLGNLGEKNEMGQEAPLDLYGTSQEPDNFNDIVETPQYTDVRQNQPDYIENLRKISNLPLAMSEDEYVRQDALDNMQYREPEIPFGVQEQQLEGLSGLMGEDQIQNPMITKPSPNQTIKEVPNEIYNIPRNNKGQLIEPLEVIRMMIEKDPSLINDLPQQTRELLNIVPDIPIVPEVNPMQMIRSILEKDPTMIERLPQQIKDKLKQEPMAAKAPPEVPIVPVGTPITEQMVDQYPTQDVQEGAVQKGFADEQILSDLNDLAGGLIPEEQKKRAEDWQDIYTKRREELTSEQNELLKKAESGNMTTFDKIALGIAVAIPILMALRYGAGAGLMSAGKALEGFASSQMQQAKNKSEKDTEKSKRLNEINKELVGLEEKNIEINDKIMNSITDKSARQFIKNKKPVVFQDGSIGIPTGDESKALYLDANKFDASDEGVKRAREVIKGADETIGIMKDSSKTVNEVLEILNQLPKDTGVWDAVKKNLQWFTSLGGANPFGGLSPKIKMKDESGKVREVDAFALLKQKINVLQDLYNKQILGGTRLTGNVVTHWDGILGSPDSIKDWLSQDLNAFKETTKSLKNTMNSREIEKLVGEGFLRKPLEKVFPLDKDSIIESSDNRLDRLRQQDPNELRKKVK
jgi:hypothetical protein